MILRSLARSVRKQDWSIVFIELLVVVIGLLLAFQVDRWWEDRKDRGRERDYISRLIAEVGDDIAQIEHAISLAEVRQGFANPRRSARADPDAWHPVEACREPVVEAAGILGPTRPLTRLLFRFGLREKRRYEVCPVFFLQFLTGQSIRPRPLAVRAVVGAEQQVEKGQRNTEIPIQVSRVIGMVPVVEFWRRDDLLQFAELELQVAVYEDCLQRQDGQINIDRLVGKSEKDHRNQAYRACQQHIHDMQA